MTNVKGHFMGIDVAKDKFDVAIYGEKRGWDVANSKNGIAKFVKQLCACRHQLIVVEATGGYEEALVLALFEAGLPVALVSPQRVRQYARAKGRLAKTDQLDAQILAEYGKTMQPRLLWARVKSAGSSQPWWDGGNSSWTYCKPRKIVCGQARRR